MLKLPYTLATTYFCPDQQTIGRIFLNRKHEFGQPTHGKLEKLLDDMARIESVSNPQRAGLLLQALRQSNRGNEQLLEKARGLELKLRDIRESLVGGTVIAQYDEPDLISISGWRVASLWIAALSVLYVLVLEVAIYRDIRLRDLWRITIESMESTLEGDLDAQGEQRSPIPRAGLLRADRLDARRTSPSPP